MYVDWKMKEIPQLQGGLECRDLLLVRGGERGGCEKTEQYC